MKAILLGILASFFFAFTFVLNRSMDLSGGSWLWSSSLRFIFMLPFLFVIVLIRGHLKPLFKALIAQPWVWVKWSFVGFVLFYGPLTFASAYGPSWLIAGTWQLTIIAGVLLSPLFYETKLTTEGPVKVRQRISLMSLCTSLIIIIGVIFMQAAHIEKVSIKLILIGSLPVVLAAFCYPLGNRKMMAEFSERVDTFQRVLGMTIASMPFWIILAVIGWIKDGPPSTGQLTQSFIVAVTSGIIATVLFFFATDMVNNQPQKLAAVEATQSGEVIFSLLGEVFILNGNMPSFWSFIGLFFIITGMIIHSFMSNKEKHVHKAHKAS
ncbi:multidrug resistance efflux transporter family protein [Scopulibacillus cellulosilyticus]|uniref:Multidrug resistance efflux transporter family protein n=1 Tax=Scopulibacillus cellulosilyticus TaxID=2665665 RepID=A0ABW2PYI7_9BACL